MTEEVCSGEGGCGDSCDPTHDDDEAVVMNGAPGVLSRLRAMPTLARDKTAREDGAPGNIACSDN